MTTDRPDVRTALALVVAHRRGDQEGYRVLLDGAELRRLSDGFTLLLEEFAVHLFGEADLDGVIERALQRWSAWDAEDP